MICKLMANNIKYELNKLGIKSYYIDLNDYGVDHIALITEFYDDELKRYLIDPTISQFKINVASLMKNKDLILNLIENGYTYINDDLFNAYIAMFSGQKSDIKLDDYLYNLMDIKTR